MIDPQFGHWVGMTEEPQVIKQPVYEWECVLMPGVIRSVEKGRAPNWFHRKMQEIAFGFKWRRVKR